MGVERPIPPTNKMKMNKLKTIIVILIISVIALSSLGLTVTCKKEVVLNETELAFLNLVNDVRVENNLKPLTTDKKLMNLAEARCSDMVARNYFSHYTSECKRIKCGEILGRAKPFSFGTPEKFLNAWLNSQSHRGVILNPIYKNIGIGIIDNNGIRIVTIIFSSRR